MQIQRKQISNKLDVTITTSVGFTIFTNSVLLLGKYVTFCYVVLYCTIFSVPLGYQSYDINSILVFI